MTSPSTFSQHLPYLEASVNAKRTVRGAEHDTPPLLGRGRPIKNLYLTIPVNLPTMGFAWLDGYIHFAGDDR